MAEDFRILTRGGDEHARTVHRESWLYAHRKGAALLGAVTLGLVGLFSGVKVGKEHFFPGDDRTAVTSTVTFPHCDGHRPLAPIDLIVIPGTQLVEQPEGSDKEVTITVGTAGELTYAPVTGVLQQPHTPGQDERTVNFVFDKAGTEHISVLGVPTPDSDPALRGRTLVTIRQLCD